MHMTHWINKNRGRPTLNVKRVVGIEESRKSAIESLRSRILFYFLRSRSKHKAFRGINQKRRTKARRPIIKWGRFDILRHLIESFYRLCHGKANLRGNGIERR